MGKRIYLEFTPYVITIVTLHRFPYFKEAVLCELFIKELMVLKQIKKSIIIDFVILYDHIHLIFQPNIKSDISKDIKSLKENFSRDANRLIKREKFDITSVDATSTSRLQLNQFILNNINSVNLQALREFKWQRSFYDHYIRNNLDFIKQRNYINENPKKHGLPLDWRYIGYNFQDLLEETD